jgi:hypothetical protein
MNRPPVSQRGPLEIEEGTVVLSVCRDYVELADVADYPTVTEFMVKAEEQEGMWRHPLLFKMTELVH